MGLPGQWCFVFRSKYSQCYSSTYCDDNLTVPSLISCQIKKTSSLVLTLSGIPKSILLSIIDMIVYGTSLSLLQVIGFSIAGAGTYHYSQLTFSPNRSRVKFEEKRSMEYVSVPYKDEEAHMSE